MDKSGLSVKDRIDLAINAIAKIKMQPIDMPELIDDLTLMENMKIASNNTTGEHPFDCFIIPRKVTLSEIAKERQVIDILNRVFGKGNKYIGMLDHKASELSYGEQRLVAMARLLMGNDRLLLLDEPTSGVNPKYIKIFANLIHDMVEMEGQTVLLIEHNMSFVRNVADYCYYLADGKILKYGTTDEILNDPIIRKEYLGL